MARSQLKTKTATKPLMIRGDRLLLALDAIELLAEGYPPKPSLRTLSLDRIRRHIREQVRSDTFSPPACIYRGEHRGGESIGFEPLHRILRCTTGLERMEFDGDAIVDVLLNGWKLVAQDREWHGFFRWLSAIASGELTEADFRGVGHGKGA